MIFTAKLFSKCSSFINQIKAISVFADTDFYQICINMATTSMHWGFFTVSHC